MRPAKKLYSVLVLALCSVCVSPSFAVVFTLEGVSDEPIEFRDCGVVASTSEPIPLVNNGTLRPNLVPALPDWRGVSCRRNIGIDSSLRDWRGLVEKGDEEAFVDVTLFAPEEPTGFAVAWALQRTWPSRWWVECRRGKCSETVVLVFNDVLDEQVGPAVEPQTEESNATNTSALGVVTAFLLLLCVVGAHRRRAG